MHMHQRNSRALSTDPFALLARDFFGVPVARSRTNTSRHAPRFDFIESAESYRLEADLPGIAEENLEITVHEGVLSISGSRTEASAEEGETFLVQERQHGSFERRFKLPKDANSEQIQAKLDEGVLRVTIAKKEERKARRIALGH